jgi:hypothetical protein
LAPKAKLTKLKLAFFHASDLRVADYMKNETLLERTLFQNLALVKLGKNRVSVEGVPMGLM